MIPKADAMFVHRRLIHKGELQAAHKVLRGLREGVIRLWLSDADFAAETALEDAGATVGISPRGDVAYCRVI